MRNVDGRLSVTMGAWKEEWEHAWNEDERGVES